MVPEYKEPKRKPFTARIKESIEDRMVWKVADEVEKQMGEQHVKEMAAGFVEKLMPKKKGVDSTGPMGMM